jgi:hypothetical protein
MRDFSKLRGGTQMAEQTLQDDMTKLVRYSVFFVKRDYEGVLKTAEEVVTDNIDSANYVTWKIAELVQNFNAIPIVQP